MFKKVKFLFQLKGSQHTGDISYVSLTHRRKHSHAHTQSHAQTHKHTYARIYKYTHQAFKSETVPLDTHTYTANTHTHTHTSRSLHVLDPECLLALFSLLAPLVALTV
jgi:hypothetical protein